MAEDWPEDKYTTSLTPETRTFQEVILHMAGSNYDMLNKMTKSKVGDGRNDPAAADYKTKAATVAFLKKSMEDGAAEAKKQGDAGVVKLLGYWDGYTEHMGEHYGLLVAYYRASGAGAAGVEAEEVKLVMVGARSRSELAALSGDGRWRPGARTAESWLPCRMVAGAG